MTSPPPAIPPELLKELHGFETFFNRMGFKRIEGAIYGLLVLSSHPLTSEEIEKTLHLSQSAVSMALKKLSHFGAVEIRESRNTGRRTKLYGAKEDSLSIVATVFRKREQEAIGEFKGMAQRLLNMTKNDNPERKKRLQGLIGTCQMAEEIIHFVIGLGPQAHREEGRALPQILGTLSASAKPIGQMASDLTQTLTSKIKAKLREREGDLR